MSRMRATRSYEYNVLCPVCQFKYKASEMIRRWDGYWVCKYDWETRHPSDFYTTKPDAHPLPFVYSDNNGTDVSPTHSGAVLTCNVLRRQPLVGIGIVGCAQLGYVMR